MDIWTLLLMSIGLAMDAFAVSVSSGIVLCHTCWRQTVRISGSFGLFQGLMPLVGYTIARTFADKIGAVDHWVAFGLLAFIGGKMLWEVFRGKDDDLPSGDPCGWKNLLVMSVATSIDALSVGFTISEYGWFMALVCSLIIAVVTFFICAAGLSIGKKFGTKLSGKASVLGGVILIGIGLEIFISGVF